MKKILKQIVIGPEKQFELLRQEVLKRVEFQNTLLTINTAFVAAFLGVGVKENYNLLLLVIPPFQLAFALMAKHNTYYMTKIDFYIQKRFKNEDSSILWETFDTLFTKRILNYQIVLNIGSYAFYFLYPVFPLLIGIDHNDDSSLQWTFIYIDAVIILLIFAVFFYFDWGRITHGLEEQINKRIAVESEIEDNPSLLEDL
jgi:hypothetical protein